MNIKDVKKIYVPSSVFLDLDKTFEFLADHLPRYYANQVLKILPKDKKGGYRLHQKSENKQDFECTYHNCDVPCGSVPRITKD